MIALFLYLQKIFEKFFGISKFNVYNKSKEYLKYKNRPYFLLCEFDERKCVIYEIKHQTTKLYVLIE